MQFQNIEEKKLRDLLEFPCEFTFKVVGANRNDLSEDVIACVQKIIKGDYQTTSKPSAKGTYQSVSIKVYATNIDQIETLYQDLAKIKGVRMVL